MRNLRQGRGLWTSIYATKKDHFVNKSYTKQMKLVAKPKEERAEVHAELGPLEPVQLKKRRGRKAT